MKRKIIMISAFAAAYLAIYILSTRVFGNIYTPEWTARSVLRFAAVISIAPLLFDKYRFALITLIGYILGVIIGEIFGKAFVSLTQPDHPALESLHGGWFIWGIVFIISIVTGIVFECVYRRKGNSSKGV